MRVRALGRWLGTHQCPLQYPLTW